MNERMSRCTPALALAAALAIAVAGCGGNSDKKANEAYANSVCSAVGAWKQQVQTVVTGLTTSGVTPEALQSAMSQVQSESKKLTQKIKDIPPPDTDSGKAAKQELDQLSANVTTTTTSAQTAISGLQGDASAGAITATLALLAPQVKSLASSAQSTVDALKNTSGGLGSAFKDAESCKSLSG